MRMPLLISLCAILVLPVQPARPGVYLQKTRTFHTAGELPAGVRVHRSVDRAQEAALHKAFIALPHTDVTVIATAPSGHVWIGMREGAVRFDRDLRSREYFAGRRWLPADQVTGIGLAGDAAWIETPAG